MKKILKFLLKILWIFPMKKNRIVFRSNHGEKYNCNPKYISEYIERNYPDEFELIWIFKKNAYENHRFLEKSNHIKVVKEQSIKGIKYLITSKFLIDNHGVMSYIPLRTSQIVINTWHGGGSYKREYSNSTKEHKKYMQEMYDSTSAFISSCEKFSECNLAVLHKSNPERILPIGMPRNDLMFYGNRKEISEKVKKALGLEQSVKIVLYAPTFRYGLKEKLYYIDPKKLTEACSSRFEGEFVLVNRLHPFVEKFFKENSKHDFIMSNDYEDMQELILAADVMITDYSSCMWDASLRNLPCFIYASDLDEYINNRGFHTPANEWPFPLSRTEDELIENVLTFKEELYEENVRIHHESLGSYENGTACQSIYNYIVSKGR